MKDQDAGEDEKEPEKKILQIDPEWRNAVEAANSLVEKSRGLLDGMHDEDKEEAIDLHERVESAIASNDSDALSEATQELKELLFFIEGK